MWTAWDTLTDEYVAVKQFKHPATFTQERILRHEIHIMNLLDHQNVLKSVDYGFENDDKTEI